MDEAEEIIIETARNHLVESVILGAVAGGLGALLGYKLAERKLRTKFEDLLDEEVRKVREFYDRPVQKEATVEKDEPPVLHSLKELENVKVDAEEAIVVYQGGAEEVKEEEPRTSVHGVDMSSEFEMADDGWDWDEQLAFREALDEGEPFVIHLEEYMRNEDGYDQICLSYYAGDSVLADDQDKDIPYPDPIVGEENLKAFGFGSGNEHVVFVQNDRLSSMFEINVVEGKYAHEILGLEHSDGGARALQRRKELRRMRSDPE